jgi:hypothetical protein
VKDFGQYAFGESGRWMAHVAPLNSRKFKFYLAARSHDTKADYIQSYEGDVRRIEPVKLLDVSFTFSESREGEYPAEPTICSAFNHMGDSDLVHFLQAVSD